MSSSRYSSFRSSGQSDPSSSADLKAKKPSSRPTIPQPSSRALATSKPKNEQSLTAMVKKFMEKKPKATGASRGGLIMPSDFLAEELKKNGKKVSGFSGLHKKLFSSGKGSEEKVALTEVKTNTRTLAMVLRSERELLSQNKDQEMEITELKLTIEEKNREVEKLKDLCLKQREEIKALKSAILFPDVMNSQLQEILEKQGSELKQAKQLIPSLQRQVTSLTGQLQFLAEDLKEVKADKYSVRECYDGYISSPRTPMHEQEAVAANSLEFSSRGNTSPGSPDDMFIKDLNPCLTPYYATKSKEFEVTGYDDSPCDDRSSEISMQTCHDLDFDTHGKKLSKSTDSCRCSNKSSRGTRRSDESKLAYGKQRQHKLF